LWIPAAGTGGGGCPEVEPVADVPDLVTWWVRATSPPQRIVEALHLITQVNEEFLAKQGATDNGTLFLAGH
ncbi:hypothetical protein ACFXDI_49360, partial [Streptomyces mirabilis]|uniref:hypothetical protein n=1 Tax=Streptomyces mirabilis TaxID=68239 RepID=UPI0036B5493F